LPHIRFEPEIAGPGRKPAYFPCSSKDGKIPSLQLRVGPSSSVPIASRSGSFSRVAQQLQTPALLVRETNPRNRAGGSPAMVSSQSNTAAVNCATDHDQPVIK
jgi:hypothetical protein